MLSYKDLINGLFEDNENVPEEYLGSFFTPEHFKDYQIDERADKSQVRAIKTMFTSRKNLESRIASALKIDPFCLEAFFTYFILTEDVFVNYRFESYYAQADHFADLDAYQRMCYLSIMDYYVEFLLDLHNITTAIKIQRLIIRLSKTATPAIVDRLALMYSLTENAEEFYRLYLDHEFQTYDYLLLLVTLLKHEDKLRAKEVLMDMFERIEYASYLDHLWDLDLQDPGQKAFYDVVEDCYDEISAIPDFFIWVNTIKEKIEE
ncbi:MAG: hypothetical protein IJL85_04740 [Erysipelotrichaceae bacterium]|nr:hypothetical protein [Erysipelotrichaceae bacterium]